MAPIKRAKDDVVVHPRIKALAPTSAKSRIWAVALLTPPNAKRSVTDREAVAVVDGDGDALAPPRM
eukprot:12218873-Ditylum_brightwellii.AAC.1